MCVKKTSDGRETCSYASQSFVVLRVVRCNSSAVHRLGKSSLMVRLFSHSCVQL